MGVSCDCSLIEQEELLIMSQFTFRHYKQSVVDDSYREIEIEVRHDTWTITALLLPIHRRTSYINLRISFRIVSRAFQIYEVFGRK